MEPPAPENREVGLSPTTEEGVEPEESEKLETEQRTELYEWLKAAVRRVNGSATCIDEAQRAFQSECERRVSSLPFLRLFQAVGDSSVMQTLGWDAKGLLCSTWGSENEGPLLTFSLEYSGVAHIELMRGPVNGAETSFLGILKLILGYKYASVIGIRHSCIYNMARFD